MKLQQLYSYVRQAIDDYQMIADGDQIAVSISGEKILWHFYMHYPDYADFIQRNLNWQLWPLIWDLIIMICPKSGSFVKRSMSNTM